MRGSVAIAGVGLAGCGEAPGWSEIEIAAAAAKNALADAGLTTRDVNGLVIASTNIFMSGLALAEHLGIRPRFTESSMVGGSSFVGHLIPAALALEAGRLVLGPVRSERALRQVDGRGFADDAGPGDWVALHWGWVCERLDERQRRNLERYSLHQLRLASDTI